MVVTPELEQALNFSLHKILPNENYDWVKVKEIN